MCALLPKLDESFKINEHSSQEYTKYLPVSFNL